MRLLVAVSLFFAMLCASFFLQGCATRKSEDVKTKIDDNVYKIIDSKWQDDLGSRVNYKVSDVNPGPNGVQIEKAVPAGGVLTLQRAVSIATAHNRQYQLEKENLYAKALDLRLARHEFEPLLFGAGAAEYIKARGGEATEEQASVGVQKLFATGARVGANVTLSWIDVLSGNARGGLSRILTVTATQPLLRGSDPNIVLENLTQAERDTLYQIRLFNRFRKTFVVAIITQYYQVLQAYDTAQNAQNNYDTLRRVYELAEKLADAGRLPLYELEQARQDKLLASDDCLATKKLYEQAIDEFKIVLSLPTEARFTLDAGELEVLRTVKMAAPEFSEAEAVETSLADRLDFANTADAINDAERKVLVAIDNMRADLRLVGATQQKTAIVSDPVTLRRARDTASAGVQIDLNLDKVAAENDYRRALLLLQQQQREYERVRDTIILEVRKAYRDMMEAAERYKVQSEQLSLAKQRFDNTMLLLQYARANTRDVLDAQKDLYRAQDAATGALVNYTVAMLRFYRDVEILQVRPDGMWQTAFAGHIR
ncbi:MAG: TolC family protein [Sedimentisphaerales bacterium]|nr:TolC family protein [Sedimentisphaerales bacterium]